MCHSGLPPARGWFLSGAGSCFLAAFFAVFLAGALLLGRCLLLGRRLLHRRGLHDLLRSGLARRGRLLGRLPGGEHRLKRCRRRDRGDLEADVLVDLLLQHRVDRVVGQGGTHDVLVELVESAHQRHEVAVGRHQDEHLDVVEVGGDPQAVDHEDDVGRVLLGLAHREDLDGLDPAALDVAAVVLEAQSIPVRVRPGDRDAVGAGLLRGGLVDLVEDVLHRHIGDVELAVTLEQVLGVDEDGDVLADAHPTRLTVVSGSSNWAPRRSSGCRAGGSP